MTIRDFALRPARRNRTSYAPRPPQECPLERVSAGHAVSRGSSANPELWEREGVS